MQPQKIRHQAKWIWTNPQQTLNRESVFFRKKIRFDKFPEAYPVCISADNRYKLYINGENIAKGPLKSGKEEQYYDVVDIAPFLKAGENIISAHCIHYPNDYYLGATFRGGPSSITHSCRGGFLLESPDGQADTNESWLCLEDLSYTFVDPVFAVCAPDFEIIDAGKYPGGWMLSDFDDGGWCKAEVVCGSDGWDSKCMTPIWNLQQRDIPMLSEEEKTFSGISKSEGGVDFSPLLSGERVTVAPNTECYADFDAGELVTAYVYLDALAQAGGQIEMLYCESYYTRCDDGHHRKRRRDNSEGILIGEVDKLVLADGRLEYSPFWFRTFRFLRITVKTGDAPVTVSGFKMFHTTYPLDITAQFNSSDPAMNEMWDISKRTLNCCMHETYEDCPYFEQLQYLMDTTIQTVLNYNLSRDDRLARKAIYDFHSTKQPSGMLYCNGPSHLKQVIPGFSLYFADIVNWHYRYFGDLSLVEFYLPTISEVLNHFDRLVNPETGIVGATGYWGYFDWVEKWTDTHGAPELSDSENMYLYSMLYGYALANARDLYTACGLEDMANRYEKRRAAICEAINKFAYDEKSGLYKGSKDEQYFCTHAQIWATLCGAAEGERAKAVMTKALKDKSLCPPSYSMTFYYLRALEKAGIYGESGDVWESWKSLLKYNITTWPEDPTYMRSDCHAWSAIPIYEYFANFLGIKPLNAGFTEILIEPLLFEEGEIEGVVPSGIGGIKAVRSVRGNTVEMKITLPKPVRTLVRIPNKDEQEFCQQEIFITFNI